MKEAVKLTEAEEQHVHIFVHRGKANARSITRARVVLKLSEGWSDDQITAAFAICRATVDNVRKRFGEGGVEAVIYDKVLQHRRQALRGQQAAHLIAIVCSPVPDGHDQWTMRLLADKAVELGFVASISPNTIHQLLKKTNSNAGLMNTGACHQSEARRVAAMEDVLDLYEESYDRKSPTVCLDEKPVVLHADVQPPVPVKPGQPERVDYEYKRKGRRNLSVLVEPTFGLAACRGDRAAHHARLRQDRTLAGE